MRANGVQDLRSLPSQITPCLVIEKNRPTVLADLYTRRVICWAMRVCIMEIIPRTAAGSIHHTGRETGLMDAERQGE